MSGLAHPEEATLGLYASGDLPAAASAAVRLHLDRCLDCRAVVQDFVETADWLRGDRLSPRAAPVLDELQRELQRRLARDVPGRRQAPWLLAWWGRLLESNRAALGEDGPWRLVGGQRGVAMAGALLLALGALGAITGERRTVTAEVPAAPVAAPARAAEDPSLRIEMQTGDPDVRIIWFASADTGRR